jgi:hypothetical protein
MQVVMMLAAQRNGEFIAYFPAQRLGLRKFEVVGVVRCALADHARAGPQRKLDEPYFGDEPARLVRSERQPRKAGSFERRRYGLLFEDGLVHRRRAETTVMDDSKE